MKLFNPETANKAFIFSYDLLGWYISHYIWESVQSLGKILGWLLTILVSAKVNEEGFNLV